MEPSVNKSHMLIDGPNLIYRAVYTKSDDQDIAMVIRMIKSYINKYRPGSVHVFWDASSNWRSAIYEEYKGTRTKDDDIKESFAIAAKLLKGLIEGLPIRQYELDNMEADDLIYSFCVSFPQRDIVIISSDGDYTQISYRFSNVKIYNPILKKELDRPSSDPIIVKSLMGDKSDNIDGYDNIGPVRSKMYTEDALARDKFLKSDKAKLNKEEVKSAIYYRNRKLIDLSMCPNIVENMEYVSMVAAEPASFNLMKMMGVTRKHNITDLVDILETIPFGELK